MTMAGAWMGIDPIPPRNSIRKAANENQAVTLEGASLGGSRCHSIGVVGTSNFDSRIAMPPQALFVSLQARRGLGTDRQMLPSPIGLARSCFVGRLSGGISYDGSTDISLFTFVQYPV